MQALLGQMVLSGDLPEGQSRAIFRATIPMVPPSLQGANLVITLGPLTLMGLQLPNHPITQPLEFGPTYAPIEELKAIDRYELLITQGNGQARAMIPPECTRGQLFEALTIRDEPEFLSRVQLHHSRFRNRDLIQLGAKAAYLRLPGPTLRGAALTVLAHRFLERDFRQLSPADKQAMRWIDGECRKVADALVEQLNQTQDPPFPLIRWAVSLSTVGAQLALCRDDLPAARHLFRIAARQMVHVGTSAVSALNLVNASFTAGLLAAVAGDLAEARYFLRQGVTSFAPMVSAQNVMANVWVIGDLIDVAHSARQCFILMVWLGLLPPQDEPVVDGLTALDLRMIKSPLANILDAGLAPRLKSAVEEIVRKAPAR